MVSSRSAGITLPQKQTNNNIIIIIKKKIYIN